MNTTSRIRHAAILVIATAFASTIGFGSTAVLGQDLLPESCAQQARTAVGVRAIDVTCDSNADVGAASCSYYDDVHGRIRIVYGDDQYCPSFAAIESAQTEAAAWPDFDPSDMTTEIAAYEAQQQAATWPDFDPSDMTTEIAAYEAQQQAANSPRMIQIGAASTADNDGDVASTSLPPVAQSPHQTNF